MIEVLSRIFRQDLNLVFLMNLSVKACLIVVCAGAVTILCQRSSAALRHWLWTLALAGILVFPLLSLSLPVWQLPVLPEMPNVAKHLPFAFTAPPARKSIRHYMSSRTKYSNPLPYVSIPKPAFHIGPATDLRPMAVPGIPSDQPISEPFSWAPWLISLWLVGFLLTFGRTLFELLCVAWIRKHAREVLEERWQAALASCERRLKLRRKTRLFASSEIAIPITSGLLRPIIILPAESHNWNSALMKIVLLHELAHIKRCDYLTNLIAQTATAFYWYNPLIWIAARRQRQEREHASDDCVLNAGTEKIDYARHLLAIAKDLLNRGLVGQRVVAMAHESELKGRLQHIMQQKAARHGVAPSSVFASALVLSLLVVPFAALHLQSKGRAEVEHLLKVEPREPVNTPIAALRNTNAEIQQQAAAWALGELSDVRSVEPLIETLQSRDLAVRAIAARALGKLQVRRAVRPLRASPQDEDIRVREMAVGALGHIKDTDTLEDLKSMLTDEKHEVRYAALSALADIGNAESLEAIRFVLADPNESEWLREKAVQVIGNAKPQGALESLLPLLRDSSGGIRKHAAHALGLIKDERAVLSLIPCVHDPVSEVRLEGVRALGRIGDSRAVDALIEALRDDCVDVRTMATWALEEVSIHM